jgi:hypothetical protein
MKTLHLLIIVILATSLVIVGNSVFADNMTTAHGGLVGFRHAYFKSDHGNYPIWYKITNGTVIGTPLDLPAKALLFEINTTSDGQLTVELPRTIIDSKNGSKDAPYFVSIYDIRSLGGPMRVFPEEISDKYVRILQINFTQGTSEIEIAGTYFVENYPFIPQKLESPLKQFKSGIPINDVKCNQGLKLIFKSEDSSPACVKPDTAQKLIERGWAWNYANVVGKESVSLSAYQGVSNEAFYNNGTVVSNFTINVNINNFKPSNASLVLQVYYNDGIIYKTVSVPPDMIQPDGSYKYELIAVSDKNHPVPFQVIATYNNETAITYAPVFAHP